MNKSIYENAIGLLLKIQGRLSTDYDKFLEVKQALEHAKKQEKLLELYREYKVVSEVTFYTLNYKMIVENTRIAKELIKQINQLEKELENDK